MISSFNIHTRTSRLSTKQGCEKARSMYDAAAIDLNQLFPSRNRGDSKYLSDYLQRYLALREVMPLFGFEAALADRVSKGENPDATNNWIQVSNLTTRRRIARVCACVRVCV